MWAVIWSDVGNFQRRRCEIFVEPSQKRFSSSVRSDIFCASLGICRPYVRGFGFLLVSILQRFRTYGAETRNSRPLDASESLFQKLNEPRGIRHGQVRRDGVTIFRDGLGFHVYLFCCPGSTGSTEHRLNFLNAKDTNNICTTQKIIPTWAVLTLEARSDSAIQSPRLSLKLAAKSGRYC